MVLQILRGEVEEDGGEGKVALINDGFDAFFFIASPYLPRVDYGG